VPTGVCGQVSSAMRGDFPWTRQECVFQGSLEAVYFFFERGRVASVPLQSAGLLRSTVAERASREGSPVATLPLGTLLVAGDGAG